MLINREVEDSLIAIMRQGLSVASGVTLLNDFIKINHESKVIIPYYGIDCRSQHFLCRGTGGSN